MERFRAYRIFEQEGVTVGRFVELSLDDLDPGEVVIQTRYSSVNYKDALAAAGRRGIIRRFPCIGGVDAAGIVVHSDDPRFSAGDQVVVTGYGMAVDHDGGYAEYVRVPADWVVPLEAGLSLFDAMALGTAGFTAALSIHRLEQNELEPGKGKVIVTGATGGVGSLAVQMLAGLGYHVVALTGKDAEGDYLRSLGAAEVWFRRNLVMGDRPLEKSEWAGALDAVGGDTLAWLTRTMQQNGVIASFGNAGGIELRTTVMPFILRGVKLLGIDSAGTEMRLRRRLWERLAGDLHPKLLQQLTECIALADLPNAFSRLIQGARRGRTVVQF